jgi:RimJ/RimL family protein N-acetyltransferase
LADRSGVVKAREEAMIDAARYRALEVLRDGRQAVIRAQRPDDREGYRAAIARASKQTMYYRFFVAKHGFSDEEAHHFLDIDYVSQVALIAEVEENGRPTLIGSARYIVTAPGSAEVSFSVIDAYQGKGVGSLLFVHLVRIGRSAGLHEFVAEVLGDNRAMLRVFERSGLLASERRDGPVVNVTMKLDGEGTIAARG